MRIYLAKLIVILVVLASLPFGISFASDILGRLDPKDVSKSRQTPFGLYLEPKAAFQALNNDPSIVLIDVRDPMEISFIGHPEPMDGNVPLRTISREFNPARGRYEMVPNKSFVKQVDALITRLGVSKSHPIFVTCRSGPRSATAADLLHKAGYKQVWNLVEGFEGSIDPANGTRSKNGWRNAGLPWRYKIKPGTEWRP